MISPYTALVIIGLWGGASWVGVWVELVLYALFNTKYFRFGPCVARFRHVFGVRKADSNVIHLLEGLPFLSTKTVGPDSILIRERRLLLSLYVDIPLVWFKRSWLTIGDADGLLSVDMEVRPHASCLLFLLTPVVGAVVVLATNSPSAPDTALFLVAGGGVPFGALFWLQLRWTKRRARQLWERIVRAIEASPQSE